MPRLSLPGLGSQKLAGGEGRAQGGRPDAAMSDVGSPPLQRDEVLALARLAHLDLSAEEADRLTGDLARILAYVRQLEEVDVSAVPPTAHVQIDRLPLRDDDEERPSLPREIALGEAPRVQDDGFAVPAFVDEG